MDSAIQTHFADINSLDSQGRSPLEYAAHFQNISAVKTLLRLGADPNISNGGPVREFLFSQDVKDVEILELLLQSGATINDSAEYGIAEAWTVDALYSSGPWSLAVDKLLMEHGMDINCQEYEETMLMTLCMFPNKNTSIDRIDQLISYGANLEQRNRRGATALHLAVANQHFMAVKVLIHAGVRLDIRSNCGDTIAHLTVVLSRSSDFVRALSEVDLAGLDLDQRNEDGHTAYDLLRKRNGLRWEKYCQELGLTRSNLFPYFCRPDFGHFWIRTREDEHEVILALEALLHQIQDSQGIPRDQQYPPLGPYLSDDQGEEPVPGAWPV